MKAKDFFIPLLYSLASNAHAHYVFGHLVVNGTLSNEWQYVRDVAGFDVESYPGEWPKLYPQYAEQMGSVNFTCGRAAILSAWNTSTATILAGDEVGFQIANINIDGGPTPDPPETIFHPGPAQIYMAAVPTGVDFKNFVGDEADWFKIAFLGASDNTTWSVWFQTRVNFTIPATTPPGRYLLRIEQIMPTCNSPQDSQFYINCAQVEIIGRGGGVPTSFARFPGAYSISDPGLNITCAIDRQTELLSYQPPGPPVWTG
jgi:hypothetical protein